MIASAAAVNQNPAPAVVPIDLNVAKARQHGAWSSVDYAVVGTTRASLILKNCWINTTDQLGNYVIARPPVILVLLSLSIYSLIGLRHAVGLTAVEIGRMCEADGNQTQQNCVRESCGGACTLEAWRRCVRLGESRLLNCQGFNSPSRTEGPANPPKPKGPGMGQNPSWPESDPTGPRKPQGPQQVTPRPQSNPTPRGPVLR
jgi:hypothetical protein